LFNFSFSSASWRLVRDFSDATGDAMDADSWFCTAPTLRQTSLWLSPPECWRCCR
jgi:hypothetical protein